ncbi:MAG: protein kinase, partial [Planctomycetales bacterium]|nr:protein kinase [Planctomycetales bacterium]
MNLQFIGHFSDEAIERYLEADLSSQEAAEMEAHLTACVQCAERITTSAAQRWGWSEVTLSLTDDEFDGDTIDPSLPVVTSLTNPDRVDHSTSSLLHRELSGWLDPTDDPCMLGRFAGYEIVGVVGHGGMAIVLKGFERSLNRFVAVKVLAPRLASSAAAQRRFEREAKAAAAVLHYNVIAIHRVAKWHGLPFLVMPYVAGESLQQRIDREGPFELEPLLRVGQQIAAGLNAAHTLGLVHRDIKPANILLDQGVERVTITDFGLARTVDDARITHTGLVAGTPLFMSPEQALGKPLDHRSDLFSLGSVLYTMATGSPPFQSDEVRTVLTKICDEPSPDVTERQTSVPAWLAELIDWCHAKSPDDRPQTAEVVERYLSEWLAHLKQPQRTPEPTRPLIPVAARQRSHPPLRWNRKLLATVLGFLAMMAGIVVILESNKGTIQIKSDVDNVPITIKKSGQLYETLTVNRDGTAIRVYAGEYEVNVNGEFDRLSIHDGVIVVGRGAETTVSIREVAGSSDSSPRTEPANELPVQSTQRKDAAIPQADAIGQVADSDFATQGSYFGMNFDGVKLSRAAGRNAFNRASFVKAELTNSKLSGGDGGFRQTSFMRAQLGGAMLLGGTAAFHRTSFKDAEISESLLSAGVNSFRECDFDDARLERAT